MLALTSLSGVTGTFITLLTAEGPAYAELQSFTPGATPVGAIGDVQFANGAGGLTNAPGLLPGQVVNLTGLGTWTVNVGRDIAMNAARFATYQGTQSASLNAIGGTTFVGNATLATTIGISATDGSGYTPTYQGGDNVNLFAAKILNNTAGTSHVLNLVGGANGANGSIFVQFQRQDGTVLAAMTQSGAAFNELTFTPQVDGTGNLGTGALRWGLVRGVVVTSGDLILEDLERGAAWKLREEPDQITAINLSTGKKYRIPLELIGDASPAEMAYPRGLDHQGPAYAHGIHDANDPTLVHPPVPPDPEPEPVATDVAAATELATEPEPEPVGPEHVEDDRAVLLPPHGPSVDEDA